MRRAKQRSCQIFCASTSLSFSMYWSKTTNFTMPRHLGVNLNFIRRRSVSEKNTLLSYLLLSPLPSLLYKPFVPLFPSFVSICLSHSLHHLMSNRHSFPPSFLLLLYSVRVQRNVPQNASLKECINITTVSVVSRWTALQIPPPTKSHILYKSTQRSYTCGNKMPTRCNR